MKKVIGFVVVLFALNTMEAQETLTFPSKDGLSITADYYEKSDSQVFILLFHQAGWSRGEYKEIAPKLNEKGYSCLAIDLRSGGSVNKIVNLTNQKAVKANLPTEFVDAYQDIEAAVAYVKKTYSPKRILLWGSSYSSALVLKYAGDNPTAVQAALSFSPGEYFGAKDYISKSAKNIDIPTFITSSKSESSSWRKIHEAIPTTTKTSYLPKTRGNHGARALWEKFEDNTGYWEAVSNFLKSIE